MSHQLSLLKSNNELRAHMDRLVELLLDSVEQAKIVEAWSAVEVSRNRLRQKALVAAFLTQHSYDQTTRLTRARVLLTTGLGIVACQCYYEPVGRRS